MQLVLSMTKISSHIILYYYDVTLLIFITLIQLVAFY